MARRDTFRGALIVIAVVVLIGSAVAPAIAQETPPAPPGNTTDGANTTTGNGTGLGSGNGSGNGSSATNGTFFGNGSDVGPTGGMFGEQQPGQDDGGPWIQGSVLPSGVELGGGIVEGAFRWGVAQLQNIAAYLLDTYTGMVIPVGAPGSPTDPGTWLVWENGIWWAAYLLNCLCLVLSIPLHIDTVMTLLGEDPYKREQRKKVVGMSLLMSFGSMLFVPMFAHLFNEASMAIAPSGRDFLATPGDFARLGPGLLMFVMAAITGNAGTVMLGFIFQQALFVAFVIACGVWPLSWALIGHEKLATRMTGMAGLGTFFGIGFLSVIQALGLRFIFWIPFDDWARGGPVMTVIVTSIALAIIWVVLPITAKSLIQIGSANAASMQMMSPSNQNRGDRYVDRRLGQPVRQKTSNAARKRAAGARGRVASKIPGRGGGSSGSSGSGSNQAATDGGSRQAGASSGSDARSESDSGRHESARRTAAYQSEVSYMKRRQAERRRRRREKGMGRDD